MTVGASTPDTPENWGAASRGYAEKVAPLMMEPFAEAIVSRLELSGAESALEVGAGSGALTEFLSSRVDSLLATDFSPEMIELLRERMAGADNVRCEVMDGQSLMLDDASVDAGASSFALMLFPNRAKGFSELKRVVRPGGRVAVSAWAGPDRFEAFALFLSALSRAFPDMPAPASPPPVFSLADPSMFAEEMEEAGFVGVDVQVVSRELQVPGFDETWAMMTVGAPPVQALFDRIGADGRDRVRDELAGLVRERFGEGPVSLTNAATIGAGTVT